MHNYYWPYDEVKFEYEPMERKLRLVAPWIQAEVTVHLHDEPIVTQVVDKFKSQTLSGIDLPVVSSLLRQFKNYPLSYTLPGTKSATDIHELRDRTLLKKSPSALMGVILANLESQSGHQFGSLYDSLVKISWEWDADSAIAFSANCDKVHPESLFSVARRYHLLDVMGNDAGTTIFAQIQSLEPREFKQVAAHLLSQNLYVTQKCHEALSAAIGLAASSKAQVLDFIHQEEGHDLILAAALKSMGEISDTCEATPETRALMQLLEFVASRNFLAFSMVIDCFERSSYQSQDPLATLLLSGGFEKAANLVNRHKLINDAGGHENIACGFLEPMALCSGDYCEEALRLTELASILINSITKSVWDRYRDGKSIVKGQ